MSILPTRALVLPGDEGWRRAPVPQGDVPLLHRGGLHEVHVGTDDLASGLVFAFGAAEEAHKGSLVWIRQAVRHGVRFTPCGEGLAGLGIDPDRLLIVEAKTPEALLRAGLDATRCSAVGAVVMEAKGHLRPYDLTASRRFVLRAETSKVPVMLLRVEAEPSASAAHSRWQVRPAPSLSPDAHGPGAPMIDVELLRQRGGPAGRRWRLEWDETNACFRSPERTPALSRAFPSLPRRRARAGGMERAASA